MNVSRTARLGLFLSVAVLVCGCNSQLSGVNGQKPKMGIGPHGGAMVSLNGQGFVEIVREYEQANNRNATPAAKLTAYFTNTDGTTPIDPLPPVSISYTSPESPSPTSITLNKVETKGAEAGGRYSSEPGPFDFDELRGELTVTINGTQTTVPWTFGPQ